MSDIVELEKLAREGSSERRRELLRGLTDMFLEDMDKHTAEESDLFGEVVCRVLDEVVQEARVELAERVAPLQQFPKDIVLKLASDDIEVATPVLEKSTLLDDSDLVQLAEQKSQAHLLAISRRESLREAVTDVLVQRGSSEVLHSVTSNVGAKFSEIGYTQLADKAQNDRTLQERLVSRHDMPRDVAQRLEPVLTEELKKRLESMLKLADEGVEGYVVRARDKVEGALKESRRDRLEVRVIIQEVKNGKKSLSDAVIKFAEENRPVHLGWLLAAVADLPENIIANALLKPNGLPIAVTCKALDITQAAFEAIAEMRCKRLKLPSSEGKRLATQYREVNPTDAARTLRFLKVRHSVEGDGQDESEQPAA